MKKEAFNQMQPQEITTGHSNTADSILFLKITALIKKMLKQYQLVLVVVGVLLAYGVPYVILGDDSFIRIHDSLDGRFSRFVSFAKYGHFDGVDLVNPSIMNGIVDNALGGKFNLILRMFLVFSPLAAIVINDVFLHVLGGVGAFLLLRDYIFKVETEKKDLAYPWWLVVGCSSCFAVLPFFSFFGGSISGLPLLLWAFLNLREKINILMSYFVIAFMPFYSFLVVTGVFVLFVLGVWFITDRIQRGSFNKPLLGGMVVLTIGYIYVEWNLVRQMFIQSGFVSHRSDWSYTWHYNAREAVRRSLQKFVHEQHHEYSLQTFTLLFSFIAIAGEYIKRDLSARTWWRSLIVGGALLLSMGACYFNWGNIIPIEKVNAVDNVLSIFFPMLFPIHDPLGQLLLKIAESYGVYIFSLAVPLIGIGTMIFSLHSGTDDKYIDPKTKQFFMLIAGALAISLFYGFFNWQGFFPIKEMFPLLKEFQLDRFYCLLPLIWFIVFGLSLFMILDLKLGKFICLLAIIIQLFYVFVNSQTSNYYFTNVVSTLNKFMGKEFAAGTLTYRQFTSQELFEEIKDFIGRPQNEYKMVSIGLYPSIATYNGFYTLDGYVNNYSSDYKKQFRIIIEKELSKSEHFRKYFDYWGSRCYIFVAEHDTRWFNSTKDDPQVINNLSINTAQLKNMGGEYIFSAWEIMNTKYNRLRFLRSFEHDNSPWKIYLYKVS